MSEFLTDCAERIMVLLIYTQKNVQWSFNQIHFRSFKI